LEKGNARSDRIPSDQDGVHRVFLQACGKVTAALRRVNVANGVGFRGPYGNSFPLEEMKGKNIVFIAAASAWHLSGASSGMSSI